MRIPKKTHHGKNIKRFREMFGIKQEALAIQLGEDWHQKRISLLEARAEIEPELLSTIAQIMKVSEEVIKNFDEEAAVNYFNTFADASINEVHLLPEDILYKDCSFNPLDKLMEVMEENKTLYERLLASEREKIEILKKSGSIK